MAIGRVAPLMLRNLRCSKAQAMGVWKKKDSDLSKGLEASNKNVFGGIRGLSAFLIPLLLLPGLSPRTKIALLFQSFPVPPRPGPSPWILVNYLVIVTVIVVAYVVYRRSQGKRGRALTALGVEMGLVFQRKGVVGPQAARLPLFKFHRKAYAKNILSGTVTTGEVLIFDYFCPRFGDPDIPTEPIEQTVAAFRFTNAELPLFHLQTRTCMDNVPNWVRRLLGARYIEVTLDSNPEFSRRFVLQARTKDVDAVRSLFTPEGVRVLASIAETDWFVEASGEWLLTYRQQVLLEPKLELYREFISRASTIASAIVHRKPAADR